MAFPPNFVKYCWVRNMVILTFSQVWYRGIRHPGDKDLAFEELEAIYLEAKRLRDAGPQPDAADMVHPAKADHMPRRDPIPLDACEVDWVDVDWDEAWTTVEPTEARANHSARPATAAAVPASA